MRRLPLRMLWKGAKTMQRVGSIVQRRLAKNVKIEKWIYFKPHV